MANKTVRLLRVVVVALTAAGVLAAIGFWYFRAFSPDRQRYPVRGVDVSHHQGKIDWRRVAADDVAFAVIKATEGGDHVDDAFATNLSEARAAGLAVGAYHFFTFCRPGADQARNFLSVVPRDQPMLPPVVDIEFGGNCPRRPTPEELRTELNAFLELVEAQFGKPAIVYLIGEAVDLYETVIPARERWVRSLVLHPGNENWVYWQYHNRGHVDGIEGAVDLNVLQGTPARLIELTR
ncbi:GH25 family lysozyme [Mesorhizobium sp. 1M-11]|uniref:glycoside hydrolase family 25 protein n=1 Tax=Mesorhizobium sp. 1M-11 TaxID=1529006 RepID=UPI0006C74CD1|nr:GH25 family lysozyme [Mesorhizobium sp. 1M-11]